MKRVDFSKLIPLVAYDGPKILVDIQNFSLVVWVNDCEAERKREDQVVQSEWLIFYLSKEDFFLFLKNKIPLRDIYNEYETNFGFLDSNSEQLLIDNERRFTFEKPGNESYIGNFSRAFLPIKEFVFGNSHNFSIEIIYYGSRYNNFKISICGTEIKDFLTIHGTHRSYKRLQRECLRVLYDPTCMLLYRDCTFDKKNIIQSFQWQPIENKRIDGSNYRVHTGDFALFRKEDTYTVVNTTQSTTIERSRLVQYFDEIRDGNQYT